MAHPSLINTALTREIPAATTAIYQRVVDPGAASQDAWPGDSSS
jgi:hypothetical protein